MGLLADLCEVDVAHKALELALTQLAHESGADENPEAPDEGRAPITVPDGLGVMLLLSGGHWSGLRS
jgi:hypothetical protein